MTDVVVVGGGVAGLVAARDLAKGGAHVVLVEAGDRLGGMLRRHTVAGLDLDMGAESFATRTDAVARLATELGLGNDIVSPDPRGAWLMTRDGRTAPIPQTGFLGIPGTPMAADVTAVIGQGGGFRAQMDSLLPSPVGAKATSLGALVRKRMGERVLDDLVVPVAGGVYSTHPDQLDPDRVAPGLRAALQREGSLARAVLALRSRAAAGSAVQGIRGGIVRLVDELVADTETYGVEVRMRTGRPRSSGTRSRSSPPAAPASGSRRRSCCRPPPTRCGPPLPTAPASSSSRSSSTSPSSTPRRAAPGCSCTRRPTASARRP